MLPYVFLGEWISPKLAWLKIGSYGVNMALGFLTGLWLLGRELRRRNIPAVYAETVIFLAIIGGVIGAKLAYVLTEAEHFSWTELISGSGLTWHGGLILAAGMVIGWFIYKKLPIPVMLDAVAPMLASGYAFGRVGCQISGDGCYGLPCSPDAFDKIFCMAYPNGIVPTNIEVHPTPLYEAFVNFVLFGVLLKIRGKFKNPGILFSIYLIVSGFSRFFVEFIRRADGRPDRFLGLRDAHLIALGQVVLGLLLVWIFTKFRSSKIPDYGIMPATPEPVPAKVQRKRKK